MAAFIQAFISVQLYAVTQSAHTNGTDFYSAHWAGPASDAFDALGSLAALDVINPVLSFLDTGSAPQPNASGTGSASTQTPSINMRVGGGTRTFDTGAIIGGAVGGVGGLGGLALAILILRRRKRRGRSPRSFDASPVISPVQERWHTSEHHGTEPEPFLGRRAAAQAPRTKWSSTLSSDSALGSATLASEGSPSAPASNPNMDTRAAQLSDDDREVIFATLTNYLLRIRNRLPGTPSELSPQTEEPPQYSR
ncbi:hypothetical protein PENSPDRAFT_444336 [Peniophora sp. CONT]|nr:hypothetical protein PENSPDRAFT_444336 [Peniophora sp. CONT]